MKNVNVSLYIAKKFTLGKFVTGSEDGDVRLDREVLLANELCEEAEYYKRTDVCTPTPQSPRPASTGKHMVCCFRFLVILFVYSLKINFKCPIYFAGR